MKISWAVFEFRDVELVGGWRDEIGVILKLKEPGFETERHAKRYVQHPDNHLQGSFVVLEVIEMPRQAK